MRHTAVVKMTMLGLRGFVLAALFLACDAVAYQNICEKAVPNDAPDFEVVAIICNDPLDELPFLDRELDGYYRAAMERSKDKEKLRQEQRTWLKQRNRCETKQCVGRAYHRRIMELTLVPAKSEILEFKSGTFGGIPSFFLTREMGLQYFDGGKSDYDMVAIARGNEYDLTKPCKDRYDFIGTGISVYAPCKGTEYGVYKPVTTFDGKEFQLFLAHELNYSDLWQNDDPSLKDSLASDICMASLLDGRQLIYEHSNHRLWVVNGQAMPEPFGAHIVLKDQSGKKIWSRYMVGRRMAPNNSEGIDRPKYFGLGIGFILLPDGTLVTRRSTEVFRLNLDKASPYDVVNARSFTLEQIKRWKEDWAHDYLKQTPVCGNDIQKCPDRESALKYLWQRFDEEMDRQFATPAQ